VGDPRVAESRRWRVLWGAPRSRAEELRGTRSGDDPRNDHTPREEGEGAYRVLFNQCTAISSLRSRNEPRLPGAIVVPVLQSGTPWETSATGRMITMFSRDSTSRRQPSAYRAEDPSLPGEARRSPICK